MLPQTSHSDKAVSPVVAVILLVAVTVTLSAVIGGFALELGQSTTDSTNQQELGVSTTEADGQYTATVVTGSADEVKLLVNGTTVDNVTNPSAGDVLSGNVSTGDTVTIITVTDNSKTVASSTTVQSSSTTAESDPPAPTAGLIAHYTFNDSTDTTQAIDATSNNYTGTINGDPTYVAGQNDTALKFDGNGDNVTIHSFNDFSNGWTFAMWFNPDNVSATRNQFLISVFSGNNDESIIVNETALVYAWYWNSNTGSHSVYSDPINDDQWYYVTFTWNTTHLNLYLNGQKVASKAASDSLSSNSHPNHIASTRDDRGYFNGTIDEVRIYDHALNESKVKQLYDSQD